ncbi:hypothetical protein KR018_011497, partial [Drosophila ironensis]
APSSWAPSRTPCDRWTSMSYPRCAASRSIARSVACHAASSRGSSVPATCRAAGTPARATPEDPSTPS